MRSGPFAAMSTDCPRTFLGYRLSGTKFGDRWPPIQFVILATQQIPRGVNNMKSSLQWPKEFRGSRLRCLMLSSLSEIHVAKSLSDFIWPHALVETTDVWRPRGFLDPKEPELCDTEEFASRGLRSIAVLVAGYYERSEDTCLGYRGHMYDSWL